MNGETGQRNRVMCFRHNERVNEEEKEGKRKNLDKMYQ